MTELQEDTHTLFRGAVRCFVPRGEPERAHPTWGGNDKQFVVSCPSPDIRPGAEFTIEDLRIGIDAWDVGTVFRTARGCEYRVVDDEYGKRIKRVR